MFLQKYVLQVNISVTEGINSLLNWWLYVTIIIYYNFLNKIKNIDNII